MSAMQRENYRIRKLKLEHQRWCSNFSLRFDRPFHCIAGGTHQSDRCKGKITESTS